MWYVTLWNTECRERPILTKEKFLFHSDTDQQEGGEKQKSALLSNELLEDSGWGV